MKTIKDLTVLYIEDESLLREEVESYLKRRVKIVWTAKDGLEGFELFKQNNPDLIITDLKMPKISGFQLIKTIREEELMVPIIVTTALSDQETIVETVDLNVDQYLVKPIDTSALNQSLEKMLNRLNRIDKDYLGTYKHYDFETIQEQGVIIQKEIAKWVKDMTGKGPKKVVVTMKGELIQIQIFSSRTKYEQSLLSYPEQRKLIDFLRTEFYKINEKRIGSLLTQATGKSVSLIDYHMDSKLDIDQLDYKILI